MDFNSWQVELAVSTPRESRPMLMKLHLICFAASFVLTFLPPFRSLASRISNFINLKYPQTTGVAVQQQQQKTLHTRSHHEWDESLKNSSAAYFMTWKCAPACVRISSFYVVFFLLTTQSNSPRFCINWKRSSRNIFLFGSSLIS